VVPTSTAALRAKWRQFMHVTPASAGGSKPKRHAAHRAHHALSMKGLTADSADGSAQAAALSHARLPVYYPRLIASGSSYCSETTANCNDGEEPATAYAHSYPRAYPIIGPGGKRYPSYRMTLVLNYILGEFYGVQGTTWNDPPILSSPSGQRVVDGRTLFLYKDGAKLTQVAWHRDGHAYWISNNLTETLSNDQMLQIAASLTRHSG
jgi:polyisoprenyl-teichoic acid--peptidoglycan teichoic acid transferase